MLNINLSSSDNEEITLSLYDIQGKRLEQIQSPISSGSNRIEINLSDYFSGIYFIRIETKNNTYSKKFILEK